MTKEKIWQAFLLRNPDVAAGDDDAKIRMTKGALRRFIYYVSEETIRNIYNDRRKDTDIPDFMKGLFN